GFGVPTLRYVDRHTLRVQHVAMIVILRGNVLRGLLSRHRSGPGDEFLADHLLGQLLRRAAVRRDDPAALLSPRLLPPCHHSLQSSGSYGALSRVLRPMGCENAEGPGGCATRGKSRRSSAGGPG